MRHGKALRKLGRTTEHRIALLRNLSTALFDKERITTTLVKAKELRPFAEKLITLARRDDLHSRRMAARDIQDRVVLKKLFDTLGPRFSQRPGGYSRILKLGWRHGDGSELALVELLGSEPVFDKGPKKKKKAKEPKEEAAAAAQGSPEAKEHAHEPGHEGHEHEGHEHEKAGRAAKPQPKSLKKAPGAGRKSTGQKKSGK
jgi:large subunit ribosomal protein L17